MKRPGVSALIPCRSGSQRVARKNTRPFLEDGTSLLQIKLKQLQQLEFLDEVVVSTDDPVCIEIAERSGGKNVKIDERPETLCRDSTNLTDLIEYFGSLCSSKTFFWTHVTSPFFGSNAYRRAFDQYLRGLESGHDSLVAVEKFQDYFIFRGEPLNFGNPSLFWPRTQELDPIFRITSALFVGQVERMLSTGNRVGGNPAYFEVDGPEAVDIDWPNEFENAVQAAASSPELIN